MRKFITFVIATCFVFSSISIYPSFQASASKIGNFQIKSQDWNTTRPNNIIPSWYATENLRMVNENRTGIEPMTLNASLMWIAQDFSKYMAETGFYGHVVPSGGDPPYSPSDPGTRMNGVYNYSGHKFGDYDAPNLAENADVWSSIDPYANMERWMASKGHHDNIVNPNLNEIGIGAYQASGDAKSCQDFGGMIKNIDVAVIEITFSPQQPQPGDVITITAKIQDIGYNDAYPIDIEFYDGDPDAGGILIGSSIHIPIIVINKEIITAYVTFDTVGKAQGTYPIFVVVKVNTPSIDTNLANNKLSKLLGLGIQVPEVLFFVPIMISIAILSVRYIENSRKRYL